MKAREDEVVREDRVYRAGVKMIVRDLKLGRRTVVAGVDNDVTGAGSACATSDKASSRRVSENDRQVVTTMPGVRVDGISGDRETNLEVQPLEIELVMSPLQ